MPDPAPNDKDSPTSVDPTEISPVVPHAPRQEEEPVRLPKPTNPGRVDRLVLRAQIKEIGKSALTHPASRISPLMMQGDIFQNVRVLEDMIEDDPEGVLQISQLNFPYVLVLTQACDLESDGRSREKAAAETSLRSEATHDKHLLSVLLAPLYHAVDVFKGEHLEQLHMRMTPIDPNGSKSSSDRIRKNQNVRYHYLEFPKEIPIPNSVLDFKHYFSVSVGYLRSIRHTDLAWTVPPLWREHISQRFAAFLARIGLPQPVPPPDADEVYKALVWPKNT